MKWSTPFYGIDGQGWFLGFHCITKYIKVAFFRGMLLHPVPPVESKQKEVRYLHIHEDDQLDEELVAVCLARHRSCPARFLSAGVDVPEIETEANVISSLYGGGNMGLIEGPAKTIDAVVEAMSPASDDEVLAALAAIEPLPDERDPRWNDESFWFAVAYRFLGLADVARLRKLRPAVRLILERACYGDPGETMRGLRHVIEGIYNPDWHLLADEYLALARAERLGTRMWAIDGLMILDDPRALPVFEASLQEDPKDISSFAKIGLKRLGRPG